VTITIWRDDVTHHPQGFPRAGQRRSTPEIALAVAATLIILALAALGGALRRRAR